MTTDERAISGAPLNDQTKEAWIFNQTYGSISTRPTTVPDPTINLAVLRDPQSSVGQQQRHLPFDSTHFVVHNF